MNPKRIHFVCRGNTYRSRQAEAIFRSLQLPGYEVSSSGIEAHKKKITIDPYTAQILKEHRLTKFTSKHWVQTTNELLAKQDIVVFVSKSVYDDAAKEFTIDARKSMIWHVKDLWQLQELHGIDWRNKHQSEELLRKNFGYIEKLTKDLATYLTHTSWVDIVDATNRPVGLRLPTAWAKDRGLWHRGCHAIITTPNKKYIVEKRSERIVFSPNHLEITLGGAVDSGELPHQAMVREIYEELGLRVHASQLKLLDVKKWSTYHPHYHKYNRCFLYTYHVALAQNDPMLRVQQSEVALATLLSRRKVNRLLRVHRLKHLGPLDYGYKYYRRIIRLSRPYLDAGQQGAMKVRTR